MQIKRVDGKPVVIHIKEKSKLHVKEEKHAKLKGRAVLTITKGPEINRAVSSGVRLHSKGKLLGAGLNKSSRKDIEKKVASSQRNQLSIHRKQAAIKAAGMMGAQKAASHVDGGEEILQAGLIMSAASRPLHGLSSLKKTYYRKKMVQGNPQKRIKQVQFSARLGKKEKSIAYSVDKYQSVSAKQKAELLRGRERTLHNRESAGKSQGYTDSKRKIPQTELANETRKRMLTQSLAKERAQKTGKEQAVKSISHVAKIQFKAMIKKIVTMCGGSFLGVAALIAAVMIPAFVIIATIYNSPFAIFFPSISSTEAIDAVLTLYMKAFDESVEAELSDTDGYDGSEKIYVDYEGTGQPDNYYDILAVYMVKYGVGDTATDMTEIARGNLKSVFDAMCSYYVTSRTETETDSDGNETEYEIKCVNVQKKSYLKAGVEYGFGEDEMDILLEIMKPENLAILGRPGGAAPGISNITKEQFQAIVDAVSDENGRMVVEFALSKVGYPYSQDLRDTGQYYDCSSLSYYAWKQAGVKLLYGGSNTAASQGQFCYDHNLLVEYDDMQPGDLIFYSYSKNGRFRDISHVAIYVGDGNVVEAANERTGVVYRSVQGKSKIVMIGRPR